MKKYSLFILLLLFSISNGFAQEEKETIETSKFAPTKGSFTASLLLGRGAFINQGLIIRESNGNVSGDSPYVNSIDANNNSITNMMGIEGKYFIKDKLAITLTGGAILRHTPSSINIPEVINLEGETIIPAYNAVIAEDRTDVHVVAGLQWYFETKSPRLLPYVGFGLHFDYARRSIFDPTITLVDGNAQFENLGAGHVDLTAFGILGVAGVDYFLTEDLFIGFATNPVTFSYASSAKKPGQGLITSEAENYTYSFFGNYSFKIGFKFN